MAAYLGIRPPVQNLAALNFEDASRFAQAQQDRENAQSMDAALRASLGHLPADSSADQIYGAVTPALAASPGGGQSLMSLRMAPVLAAQKAAPQFALAKAKFENEAALAGQKADAERQNVLLRNEGSRGVAEINASSRERVAGMSHADRVANNVADLIGKGQVDAARTLAEQGGERLPDAFWQKAATDGGFRQLVTTYKGDSKGFSKAVDAYHQNGGDVQAAIVAAGAPKSTAAGHGPADLQVMDWLMQPDPKTGKPLAADRQQAVQLLQQMRAGRTRTTGYAVQMANAYLQSTGAPLPGNTPEEKQRSYQQMVADFDAHLRGQDTSELPDVSLPGAPASPQAPQAATAPAALPPGVTPEAAIAAARRAIAQGASAVDAANKLRAVGVDPSGL